MMFKFDLLKWSIITLIIGSVQLLQTKEFSECGLRLERVSSEHERHNRSNRVKRIVGGQTSVEPWPWMAALFFTRHAGNEPVEPVEPGDEPVEAKFECGGSIVGRQWILTTAHCLMDFFKLRDPQTVIVKLGLTDLENETNLQEFEPLEFKVHEEFNIVTINYDIALIKLNGTIEYNPYVRPICLPPENLGEDTTLYKPGANAFVTGWGYDQKVGEERFVEAKHVDYLKELRQPIQTEDRCRNSLKNPLHIFTDKMLCAGDGLGEDGICMGDAGGPLMQSQLNKEGNVYWVQVGIASWGIGCAQMHTYGFYTHVYNLRKWIVDTISSN